MFIGRQAKRTDIEKIQVMGIHLCTTIFWHGYDFYYHPQRSCEGYVFTGVSLSTRGGGWYPSMPCRWYPSMPCSRSPGVGVVSQHALQVVCQHALQQVPKGCLLGGGVPAPGRGYVEETPPASRQLLLRTVRILLECILVY